MCETMTGMYEKPLILVRTGLTNLEIARSVSSVLGSFPVRASSVNQNVCMMLANGQACFQDRVLFLCDFRGSFAFNGVSHAVVP